MIGSFKGVRNRHAAFCESAKYSSPMTEIHHRLAGNFRARYAGKGAIY
jgi:hypothetical protein